MKKLLLAAVLALATVSSIINLGAPKSYAQEAPEPPPKPEKPDSD